MKHLLRHTIWAPDAIPLDEWKFRSLKQLWLPLYDLVFIWAGLVAIRHGVPSIQALVPELVSDLLGYTFVVVAFLCLVGVSIPRLWVLEVAAKFLLLAILATYFIALRMVESAAGTGGREFISVIAVAAGVLILFRFTLLFEEYRERRRRKRTDDAEG